MGTRLGSLYGAGWKAEWGAQAHLFGAPHGQGPHHMSAEAGPSSQGPDLVLEITFSMHPNNSAWRHEASALCLPGTAAGGPGTR